MSIPVEHIVAILSVSTAHAAATAGVGARNRRYDVFHHALRVRVRHARDVEGVRALRSGFEHPSQMFRIVGVERVVGTFPGPSNQPRVLHAVRRVPRRLRQRAQGKILLGGKSHIVHSKQGVTPGKMTLAWPLNPSVPPSTIGLIVD